MSPYVLSTRNCSVCTSPFTPLSARHKYCSEACRRGISTCEICETKFTKKANSRGRFCSQQCWRRKLDVDRTKVCLVCGVAFVGTGKKKTCSYKCADSFRRSPLRRSDCELCGVKLRRDCKPSTKYCSRTCSARAVNRLKSKRPEGSTYEHASGYVVEKRNGKWVFQHRLVMEEALGRVLAGRERVHHKNGNRRDNRTSNLELWTLDFKDPPGVRASDRQHCESCQCFSSGDGS